MKKIKIGFSDFWGSYELHNCPIFNDFFNERFEIVYDNNNPDILIFSVFGNNFRKYSCPKILFTPENFFSHRYIPFDNMLGLTNLYKYADFSITSFEIGDERNFRMPCYIRRDGYGMKKIIEDRTIPKKSKKILFMHRNCIPFRDNFFDKLSKYIQIDSPSACRRNMHINVIDKISFMQEYKFVLSFENSSWKNYNTEKIVDGFLSKTLPIYWGDTTVENDFNSLSMINYHNFPNEEMLIDEILRLDSNDEEYYNRISLNPIKNNDIFDQELFYNFMNKIFHSI